MSAEPDLPISKKPYGLTLKGVVTVHYLDGQTLEGEIAAQDELNIWLTIDDTPYLIPRQQIRYVKGQPGQPIEPEPDETELPADPFAYLQAVPVPQVLQEAPPSKSEPEPKPEPEPESSPAPAQFVEEIIVFPPPDEGGTMVIPSGIINFQSETEATGVHPAVSDESADVGSTVVLSAGIDLISDTVEREAGVSSAEPDDIGATELLPALDLDEDVTFVLGRTEGEEVSAHLICTSGPHAGEVLKLKTGVTTIGRSSDNGFPLSKDKEASRRHALIVYEASKFVLQDQSSLNGTFVNDQLIKEPYPLQDGDIILIGISTLKFQESPK